MKLGEPGGCSHCCWRSTRTEDIGPLSFTLCRAQELVGQQTPFILSGNAGFSKGISDFGWAGKNQGMGPFFHHQLRDHGLTQLLTGNPQLGVESVVG